MEIATLLETMRQEARADHQALVKKVDDGFMSAGEAMTQLTADFNEHKMDDVRVQGDLGKRLQPLETLNSGVKWVIVTLAGAVVTVAAMGLWDVLTHHLK